MKPYAIFADQPEPMEQLAETLSEHGEHLMAIQLLNRAVALFDASPRLCFHRSVALEKFLLYNEAAEAFKDALLKITAEKREHDLASLMDLSIDGAIFPRLAHRRTTACHC